MAIHWEAGHFCQGVEGSPVGHTIKGVFTGIIAKALPAVWEKFRIYVRVRASEGHHTLKLRILSPDGKPLTFPTTKSDVSDFPFDGLDEQTSVNVVVAIERVEFSQYGSYGFVFMDEQTAEVGRLYLQIAAPKGDADSPKP